jgi:hypothetical protein
MLKGESLGSASSNVVHDFPDNCYSYIAHERHKRIEQTRPTVFEIQAMQRVLFASRLNKNIKPNIAKILSSHVTGLAIADLLRARRARPLGVEVQRAFELLDSPRHRKAELDDSDIPY